MSWKLKLTASSLTPAACRIFQANISVYTWLLNWNSLGTLTFFISNPSWILISRFFCSLFENTFKLLNIWSQGLLSPRLAHTQWLACAVCNSSSFWLHLPSAKVTGVVVPTRCSVRVNSGHCPCWASGHFTHSSKSGHRHSLNYGVVSL